MSKSVHNLVGLPSQYTDDPQELKDAQWLGFKRQAGARKNRGTLDPRLVEIAAKWGFDGAFDIIDRKAEALRKLTEILHRAKARGSFPIQNKTDRQQNQDAHWISERKEAKHNSKAGVIWDSSFEELVVKCGYPDAFKTRKEYAIEKAHEVFSRAKQRGFLPRHAQETEAEDYTWIKISRKKPYLELHEIAKYYGFPDAFKPIDYKQRRLNAAHEVFSRAKQRGHLPRILDNPKTKADKLEDKDANWISFQKVSKHGVIDKKTGKIKSPWYSEIDDIAIHYGYTNVFEKTDFEQENIARAREIFQKCKLVGSLPNPKTPDGRWIYKRRVAKSGGKTTSVWYEALDAVASEYGFPNAFAIIEKFRRAA